MAQREGHSTTADALAARPALAAVREVAALESAAPVGFKPDTNIRLARSFPLAAVVGMDAIKQVRGGTG